MDQTCLLVIGILCCFLCYAKAVMDSSVCTFKYPKEDFTDNDAIGSSYIIAIKKSFPIQEVQSICGIIEFVSLGKNIWQLNNSYQFNNGTVGNTPFEYLNGPPGVFSSYNTNNENVYIFTIIGAEPGKFKIGYSCNYAKGTDGVWILYKSRVQGLDNIDSESKAKILTILKNNGINIDNFNQVQNTNCKN